MDIPLLVSTEWLAKRLGGPNIRIVDVRWYLFEKDKNGRTEYLDGHIPGAVFMNLNTDLAAPVGEGPGRHPLPSAETFAAAASRAGIGPEVHVIAYDDRGAASAARLWWLLRYFGHDRVSLLDGGIAQWTSEGRPLERQVPAVTPTRFVPRPRPEMLVDQATMNALRDDPKALILDVRVPERYQGQVEPIDPRAGHVPGARNAPIGNNLRGGNDMRFREPEALHEQYHKLGADHVDKIVCYCGSGVNACQSIFALQVAGFNAILYEGSWSDWSSNPDRPVATGPKP